MRSTFIRHRKRGLSEMKHRRNEVLRHHHHVNHDVKMCPKCDTVYSLKEWRDNEGCYECGYSPNDKKCSGDQCRL